MHVALVFLSLCVLGALAAAADVAAASLQNADVRIESFADDTLHIYVDKLGSKPALPGSDDNSALYAMINAQDVIPLCPGSRRVAPAPAPAPGPARPSGAPAAGNSTSWCHAALVVPRPFVVAVYALRTAPGAAPGSDQPVATGVGALLATASSDDLPVRPADRGADRAAEPPTWAKAQPAGHGAGAGPGTASQGPRVGILYEGWHGYAAHAMAQVAAKGGQQLSVEQVVRGNGKYVLNDIFGKYGISDNLSFLWQSRPQLGYYCIYRRAEGGPSIIPDCPGITETLTRHAKELLTSGVDYVLTDSTNLDTPSDAATVIQVRPMQVLFEEWARLRASGVNTPDIAVWQRSSTGSTLWQTCLDLYNNASYADLVLTVGGKKVFFVPLNPDPSIVAKIESNGGRNDIVVITMWAQFALSEFSKGMWAFFSPCTTASGEYTDTILGRPCNQHITTNSPLGSALGVSPSYQLEYGSLPFGAPGKLHGFTFQQQFATALSTATTLDNLFLSSWNEFIAQPQPNPFHSQYAFSMGTPWDPARSELFVDTYGWGIGRDIEPSVEGGSEVFDMMQSCLRMVRLRSHTGASGCHVSGEICCTANSTQAYSNVWSLGNAGAHDNLLSTSAVEVHELLSKGWTEYCTPFVGTDGVFCQDKSIVTSPQALRGPFIIHATLPSAGGFTALYRCYTGQRHFFSPSSDCEGQKVESVLGYLSPQRSTDTPRGLRRCRILSTDTYYHVLDGECDAGDASEGFYGYVR